MEDNSKILWSGGHPLGQFNETDSHQENGNLVQQIEKPVNEFVNIEIEAQREKKQEVSKYVYCNCYCLLINGFGFFYIWIIIIIFIAY